MYWQDEGYLLSKNNFDENSIIIETFTLNHGKYSGIVYGGSSKKQKKKLQLGNKIFLNWRSKGENKTGYFTAEIIKAVVPSFFDDKKKAICILAALSILKTILPEREINKKIYLSFDKLINQFYSENWINKYILWEILLIKELGFEDKVKINNKLDIKEALIFNKNLFLENFMIPNNLQMPFSRNILEKYYN